MIFYHVFDVNNTIFNDLRVNITLILKRRRFKATTSNNSLIIRSPKKFSFLLLIDLIKNLLAKLNPNFFDINRGIK